jgi:gentisate 1,2-dioxygenase
LDVLDIHLTAHLDAMFQENYGEGPIQPVVKPDGYCRQRLGAVRPRTANAGGQALPYTYKWTDTVAALKEVAEADRKDPHDGILLEYTNPLTGGPTMPTIGCWIQWLPPGETTKPHRHTSSTIYHVVEGEGVTTVGEKKGVGDDLTWGPKDCFFVPSWKWHEFRNRSKKEAAIIFSVTDRPVLESLGLYREEQD